MQSVLSPALLASTLLFSGPLMGREVWHAARPLLPGDTLRAQDITPAAPRRDDSRFVDSDRDIVGLEVKRPIRANAPIPDRDIGQRPLVRATQPVRVFWKSDGMTLEMQGKALESGASGEEIRVHNPGSGRTLRALVVAEGTAEIRGAP
jgi:flagella basal body P-ring formation protein FlgA